jgi:hypothetical protein
LFGPGAARVYHLELKTRAGIANDGPAMGLELTAEVAIEKVTSEAGVDALELALSHPQFRSEKPAGSEEIARVANELERPSLVTMKAGRMNALFVERKTSPLTVSILRSVAAGLQFPTRLPIAPVEATENDSTGTYVAQYSPLGPGHFGKRKLSYLHVVTTSTAAVPTADIVRAKVDESTGEIRIEQGSIRHVSQREMVSVSVGGTDLQSATQLTLALVTERAAHPPRHSSVSAESIEIAATEPYFDAPRRDPLDAARIGGATFAELLHALEAQTRESVQDAAKSLEAAATLPAADRHRLKADLQRRAQAFTAMSALLRARPAEVRSAVRAIRRGSVASVRMMSALAAAGTDEAQAALIALMSDKSLSESRRLDAGDSLFGIDVASPATTDALVAWLDDPLLSMHAAYGLGTLARKLREAGQADRADRMSRTLVVRLASARSLEDKARLLRGIANSAFAGAVPAVRPFLTDEDESLREVGVQALHLIVTPEVDGLLAERVREDKAPSVREEALQSAMQRPASPELAVAVDAAARGDDDDHVRYSAVELAANWLGERPEFLATLDYVAEHDKEPGVQKAARAALDDWAARSKTLADTGLEP